MVQAQRHRMTGARGNAIARRRGGSARAVSRFGATPAVMILISALTAGPAAAQDTAAAHATPACAAASGATAAHTAMHESIDSDGGQQRWQASWSTGGCTTDLHATGTFTFARDLSDLTAISPGGYFELVQRDGAHTWRYEVRPGSGGELERHWTVDGNARPFDADARRQVAALLLDLERYTAYAAPGRVSLLLAQGGAGAVLDEISHLESDYARRVYYATLLDSARLNESEARRAMQQAGREISSDYDLATVLVDLGERGLVTATTSAAYVEAARSIQSDYDHRRVLTALVEVRELPPSVVGAVLRSAEQIGSDYDRAELLTVLAARHPLDDSLRHEYVHAANGISSDFQRRRALSALLNNATM